MYRPMKTTSLKSTYTSIRSVALIALLAVSLTACDSNIAGEELTRETDIVDVATSQTNFITLRAAIDAAGLTQTLRSDGPFTVFAPSDDAFAELPESALRQLLKPEHQDKLVAVLTYHVVSGRVYANDILDQGVAKTAEGSDLTFLIEDDGVSVNGARITAVDIEASNGLVHVIDTVMLPDWVASWVERSDRGPDIPIIDVIN